ncbi:excinuclease ABC subunit UvrB [Flammeovirga sp. SubArs3]|uniref:excinuclease ABC subunit UvrB n=1 Tax=Flammeovirga sp. SubArs3 TaxID=2995316 RepID=UPI00248C744A|nr:excinuclease ABC subunit UvrB [Flammeovirga sp. SubArs3]
MDFKLVADFTPMGDQPQAIKELAEGVETGESSQILLGVTGSGKTFSIANVIKETNRPTLILSHNKTLAAQLYGEFKQFFPENAVEYFISYYDYYQPEAYIQTTDTFIEKDLMINDEIEKLRLSCTSALLSGRRDVIVVASVSCIYGIGNPEEFGKNVLKIRTGIEYPRQKLLRDFVDILYSRNEIEFNRGNFRVKGDTVDIYPAYADFAYRIIYWDDEIEEIQRIDPETGKMQSREDAITIFPANLFVTGKDTINESIIKIQDELVDQIKYFEKDQRTMEAKRIKERTEFDLEMIRELGYCSGIENYSRFFDRRRPGQRPFCLLDYFPDDFLMVIDESHVTLPQIRAMWGGDRSRKISLVDNGFRLPSALDNRPLTFNEFENVVNQSIYVSATPGEYELLKTEGAIIEQVIRPTGLLDPEIDVRPTLNQIDDLLEEVTATIEKGDRVLITTLTKRMAEELSRYLDQIGIKSTYLHSEIKPLDRVEILRELRLGIIDVLVGVNLLREGLDLPEVSLVAIMDADKEGFLRNERSLIQTIGRAARNSDGRVIMYADKMTKSMNKAISETKRRRQIQHEYNLEHGITPRTVRKSHDAIIEQTQVADKKSISKDYQSEEANLAKAAEEASTYQANSKKNINEQISQVKKEMEKAASDLDFVEAARLRDIMFELERVKNSKV